MRLETELHVVNVSVIFVTEVHLMGMDLLFDGKK